MIRYNSAAWYWIGQPVGQSSPIIYSSAGAAVVPSTDATYEAWVAAGGVATPWPRDSTGAITTAALDAVLTAAGLPITGLTALTQAQEALGALEDALQSPAALAAIPEKSPRSFKSAH